MKQEIITDFVAGERLDKELARLYPQYSRAMLVKITDNGAVSVNGGKIKNKYKLKSSDKLTINLEAFEPTAEVLDLPVIFENNDVIVINKPTGVLTHSKGAFNDEPTIASFILPKLNGSDLWKASNRAGIVHRLDRATSGIIISAKTEEAQKFLQKQFAKRNVKKVYIGLLEGNLKHTEANLDLPIERSPKKPQTFRVGSSGKPAETHYKVIKSYKNNDLVELRPKTGRTHQLRVHMAYLNCPIINDHIYSKSKPHGRLFLQAAQLEITLPSSERKVFNTLLPDDLQLILNKLEQ